MKFSIKDFFSKRDQIRSLISKDPCFSGSRFFRVKVFQCPGSGFRSNIFKLLLFLSFALFLYCCRKTDDKRNHHLRVLSSKKITKTSNDK